MQFWVPSSFRGTDPTGQSQNSGPAYEAQTDTSNGNRMIGNVMGLTPRGVRDSERGRLLVGRGGPPELLDGATARAPATRSRATRPCCRAARARPCTRPINPAKLAALGRLRDLGSAGRGAAGPARLRLVHRPAMSRGRCDEARIAGALALLVAVVPRRGRSPPMAGTTRAAAATSSGRRRRACTATRSCPTTGCCGASSATTRSGS